jgi:hypothetical protein
MEEIRVDEPRSLRALVFAVSEEAWRREELSSALV